MTVTSTDFGDNAGPTLNKTVDVVGGVEKVPTYDANGNMDSVYEPATGQTTTYRYDAEDRLVQIVKAGTTYTLGYDGFSRMRTLSDGTTTKTFMWLGLKLAEERNATGATVAKEFFGLGVRDNGVNKYYTRDHLGSIRELMAADGTTVLARYDYDPYGRRVKVAGSDDADFGFTGHYYHAPSGLHLAPFRAYDADLGRWLNRDPIGETGGANLYGYVYGDPINWVDKDGQFGLLLVAGIILLLGAISTDTSPPPPQYAAPPQQYPPGTTFIEPPENVNDEGLTLGSGLRGRAQDRMAGLNAGLYDALLPLPTCPKGLPLKNSVQDTLGSGYQAVKEVTTPIKNTDLLRALNDTSSGNWVKVYEAGLLNGSKVEVHYFRNELTKDVFDAKSKYDYWHQKGF